MARALNLARRQLDREQKRKLIVDQLRKRPTGRAVDRQDAWRQQPDGQ